MTKKRKLMITRDMEVEKKEVFAGRFRGTKFLWILAGLCTVESWRSHKFWI